MSLFRLPQVIPVIYNAMADKLIVGATRNIYETRNITCMNLKTSVKPSLPEEHIDQEHI